MAKRRAKGEGSIFYSESHKSWVAEIYIDGKKKRKYSKRQSVVREWLLTQRNAVKTGVFIADEKVSVSKFLRRYLEDIAAPTLKPKTIDSYTYLIEKHIIPHLGDLRLIQVRPDHLQTFYNLKLSEGLSKRTVQYCHAVLRRAFNQAVNWELLIRNPTDAVSPPQPQKQAPVTLSVDQIKKFLESVKDHSYYHIYLLAVGCGLREGEILALEGRDIRLPEGAISVRQTLIMIGGKLELGVPKSEKSRRVVMMPDFVIEELKKIDIPEGLIFTTRTGRPISPRNLLRHFHASLAKAGIPRVKFHSLRHSFATIHLLSGTNPKVVQEALGHSTISLTLDTYSHVIPTLQKEAAKKLDGIFN
jgi:integrase